MRGDFDGHDDSNNDHKDDVNDCTRTTSSSFLTQQPTCGLFLEGRGGDFNDDDNGNNAAY